MPKIKSVLVVFLAGIVLGGLHTGPGALLFGQGGSSTKQTGTEQKLTAQQSNGERVFVQRCSLCHLQRRLKDFSPAPAGTNPPSLFKCIPSSSNTACPATVGPNLAGVFKGASPAKEKALRQLIEKGTQNMPGFQYGLEPKEMDDVIAYLKTM